MARFEFFAHAPISGYLLDVQANIIGELKTRVVVPLMPLSSSAPPIRSLHPVLQIEGMPFLMHTHLIGAVPLRMLRGPAGTLRDRQDDIMAALDMLFTGF